MTSPTANQTSARLKATFGLGRGWSSQAGRSATVWEMPAYHLLWFDDAASDVELRRLWEARKGRQAYPVVRTSLYLKRRTAGDEGGGLPTSTADALDDRFDDAGKGLEWLAKLGALRARSASDQPAYEAAEYVMKLRSPVTELAGNRTVSELSGTVGAEMVQLVEELRRSMETGYWHTRILLVLLKSDP